MLKQGRPRKNASSGFKTLYDANPDPDPTINFDADPDPTPASHQSGTNLRPLVYGPSTPSFEPPCLYCARPRPSAP
jgi:hypothetical protein